MKRRKYIFPAFAGLALALASCSSTPEESTTQGGDETQAFDRGLLGEIVLDYSKQQVQDRIDVKSLKEISYTIDGVAYTVSSTLGSGVQKLQDAEGNLVVYSTQLEKIVYKGITDVTTGSAEYQRFFARCIVGEEEITIDQYGNEIFRVNNTEDKLEIETLELVLINNKYYYKALYSVEHSNEYKYFEIDSNLKLKEIEQLPKQNHVSPSEGYDGPKVNELFGPDRKELSNNRYLITSFRDRGLTVSLFENDTLIKSFSTSDMMYNKLLVLGDKIFIQEVEMLADDVTEYDYLLGEKKFKVKQTLVDPLTLEEKDVKLDYLIVNDMTMANPEYSSVIKDGDKEYYACFAIKKGTPIFSEVDAPYRVIVMDSNLNVVDDSSFLSVIANIKLKDAYYNEVTWQLFDKNMNLVADLSELETVYVDYKNSLIYGSINGKYGIIGTDGKVKAEFIYNDLKPLEDDFDQYNHFLDVKDDCIIALKGDSYYRINVKTGETKLLGDYMDNFSNLLGAGFDIDDLYTLELDDKIYVMDQSKVYFELSTSLSNIAEVELCADALTTQAYILIGLNETDGEASQPHYYKIDLNMSLQEK